MPAHPTRTALLCALLATALPAQQPKAAPAYPERDALSPFRNPQQIMAAPDALFAQLRTMRRLADDPAATRAFGSDGREVIDDELWRSCRREVERLGVDAGILAAIMRDDRNADQRAVAFYAMFYVANEEHVFELISHIPGEPERRTRELALPRAIQFLRAQLGRKFGDLSADEQQQLLRDMPQPGSPAAKARGITRLPQPDDLLFSLRLVPFLQLLDQDDALDQAQALWFLKECFTVRRDMALPWLEPALPRVRQLLATGESRVREQAIGMLAAIGPRQLRAPDAGASTAELDAFADQAVRELFPPIRRIAAGLFALFPGPERDALVAAGRNALLDNPIGEGAMVKLDNGGRNRGFRVGRVPAELAILGIPTNALILSINGTPVYDGASVWKAIGDQFQVREKGPDKKPVVRQVSRATIIVELLVGDSVQAIEYRVL